MLEICQKITTLAKSTGAAQWSDQLAGCSLLQRTVYPFRILGYSILGRYGLPGIWRRGGWEVMAGTPLCALSGGGQAAKSDAPCIALIRRCLGAMVRDLGEITGPYLRTSKVGF